MNQKLHIYDSLFGHAKSTSLENTPKYFQWERSYNPDLIFFSDSHLHYVDQINSKKKIAWLIETPSMSVYQYQFILRNYEKFYKIFTHNKNLLENIKNTELLPIGGCWINEQDQKIYDKNKNVSIIASGKNSFVGHMLRHEIISKISGIDVFGFAYKKIDNKIEGLRDYKFSIVVENAKEDYYFTEKIIDCFVTGTIPIYWGCPSIGNFFDVNGIISFDNIEELQSILNNLEGIYESKLESIKKNYDLSMQYRVGDDLIYEKIKNEINN